MGRKTETERRMGRFTRNGMTRAPGGGYYYDYIQCRHSQSTMALNLVSNSYLEENTAKIRVKQVPWEVRGCCLRRLSPHTDCVNLD